MERGKEDDIRTPSTSRSNSMNDDEDEPSSPPPSPLNEETVHTESLPPKDTTTSVAEQIKATIAAKRNTFISSSSSSSASESETDFVALNKQDFDSISSPSTNAVSLLTGYYAQLLA